MSNTEVKCPDCGSLATSPRPIGWPGTDKMDLQAIWLGTPTFNNPKWVGKFRSRQIGAICNFCKYEFDVDTPARARNSGAANVATEKRSAVERMKDLVELRAGGVITEDEFQQKREDILRGL